MKRFFQITGFVFLALLLLLLSAFFYFQTPAGQAFLTKKVVSYLKQKVDKPFKISKINYQIPDWIALEGVYFSDNRGDTLLAAQRLYVNMDMLGLLQNRVSVNEIELENSSVNLKTLTDSTFNFSYLLAAFQSPKTIIDTTQSAPFHILTGHATTPSSHICFKIFFGISRAQ